MELSDEQHATRVPGAEPRGGKAIDITIHTAHDPRLGKSLGKFQFTRIVGKGGMGMVYEAVDTLLLRKVAIKLLPQTFAEDKEFLERFLHEARSAARLSHPHVVSIYEVDQRDGQYYIAMELVHGGSADDLLRERKTLPWPQATRIIAEACKGLTAAHSGGFIHRDIKPSNLLLTPEGEVKVGDFGLAKSMEQGAPDVRHGEIMGTPAFMSPEQCRGGKLDARTDIYSLGTTYYALLTGQPPYDTSTTIEATIHSHCYDPVPELKTGKIPFPRRCALIIRKSMAKNPADRYQTAEEMREDLEKALEKASPADTKIILKKGSNAREYPSTIRRRRRWHLRPLVAGVAAVVLVAGIGTAIHFRNQDNEVETAESLSGQVRSRLKSTIAGHPKGVFSLAVSPDGKSFASGGADNIIRIRSPLNGKPTTQLRGHSGTILALTYSQDGDVLLSGSTDKTAALWDTRTAQLKATLEGHTGEVRAVAISPNGVTAATGAYDRTVRLWNTSDGHEQAILTGHMDQVRAVTFSPDGKTLASASWDKTVKIWDAKEGKLKTTLTGHANWVFALAFSPDGTTLASASADLTVKLWNTETWQDRGTLEGHKTRIVSLAFSPDGKWLATGSWDHTAKVWDAITGEEVTTLKDHGAEVNAVVFSSTSKSVITGSKDGFIKLWFLLPALDR